MTTKSDVPIWSLHPLDYHTVPTSLAYDTQVITLATPVVAPSVRLRLSNVFGTKPLVFTAATVQDVAVPDAAALPVTQGGSPTLMVPAGGTLVSDAIELTGPTPHRLCVTLTAVAATVETLTWTYDQTLVQVAHRDAAGAAVASRDLFALAANDPHALVLYGLQALLVPAPAPRRLIALGDSITQQGYFLGAMAQSQPGLAIVNLGVSGNRALRDTDPSQGVGNQYGTAAVSRAAGELAACGAGPSDLAVVLLGINDLVQPGPWAPADQEVPVAALLAGFAKLQAIVAAAQVPAVVSTLLPFGGSDYHTKAREAVRQTLNQAILAGRFGVSVDLAAAVADPKAPTRYWAVNDSGDHVHPTPAAGALMARQLTANPVVAAWLKGGRHATR
ncbi:GDSL-type esterase/lipase family protein [Lacticaseibacillus suihuaensis]